MSIVLHINSVHKTKTNSCIIINFFYLVYWPVVVSYLALVIYDPKQRKVALLMIRLFHHVKFPSTLKQLLNHPEMLTKMRNKIKVHPTLQKSKTDINKIFLKNAQVLSDDLSLPQLFCLVSQRIFEET